MSSLLDLIPKLPRMSQCLKSKKKVLVRVDINVPIDVEKKIILDDFRIEAHSKTIQKLLDNDLAIVILAHQGRPGGKEFTSLDIHAKYLSKYIKAEVNFIDDVLGPSARDAIKSLKPGEVLLLDNVRFVSEEVLEKSPEAQAKTFLVTKLAPLFDHFILDAFAAAHRSQPSIVGFPLVLPSCMGIVMESEVDAMYKILSSREGETVLIAGGAKIPETIKAINEILKKNIASKVLVGGLVGSVFSAVKTGLKGWFKEFIESKGLTSQVEITKELLNHYSDRIVTPIDYVIEINGEKKIVSPENVTHEVMSIGPETVKLFTEHLRGANIAIMTGPVSYVEKEEYLEGTVKILEAMITHTKYTVIGGGHTIMAAKKSGLVDKINHVSTGGRAFLYSLAGEELAGLKALLMSKEKFWGGV